MFQAREFKANPMRPLTPVLPPKRPQTPTKPVPFDLEVDIRGAAKAEEFKKQVRGQHFTHCASLVSFISTPRCLAGKFILML